MGEIRTNKKKGTVYNASVVVGVVVVVALPRVLERSAGPGRPQPLGVPPGFVLSDPDDVTS